MNKHNTLESFLRLLTIMDELREKCPWDKKQTNDSLQKYAIEEVFELIEAISNDDKSPLATDDIKGELGDVLLQIVFHAHLYAEQARFDMADVIYTLQEKLIRRHPHVFDKENLKTDEDVKRRWDEIKQIENQDRPKRLLSDVKAGTALMTAQNLQKQAGKVGFDWHDPRAVILKLREELDEIDHALTNTPETVKEELGDLLFCVVNLARHLNFDTEQALKEANVKFARRFGFIEDSLTEQNKTFADSNLGELEHLWQKAKDQEKQLPASSV